MENTIKDAEHFVTFYEDQDGNSFVGNRLFAARMLREYGKKLTISNYAASVSPKLVLPERMKGLGFDPVASGWNACLSELRRLNPSLFK